MTVTSGSVREIFKGLQCGDGAAFFAHVTDDVDWTVMGAHPFAGDYRSRVTLVAGTSPSWFRCFHKAHNFMWSVSSSKIIGRR
jgi:ketosteroid isomerase-like protein